MKYGHSGKESNAKVRRAIPSPLTSSVRPSPPSSPRGNARVGRRQIQQLSHDLKNSISRNPHLSIQGIPGKTGP